MDNDKPFKTIEVIDSKTRQLCKIACMSCIRGHRTTSCGIPVCRSKVFWTVKRPGRPSNSCTCRFGATGGCKCVVARAACPHKSKKGEKRSGECRCDEFGRYCCLLEPEHWTALLSLRKPTVDFYPTREALEKREAASRHTALPSTPAHTTMASPPPTTYPVPAPPVSQAPVPIASAAPNAYSAYERPMSTALTPRFGIMGIGAPMGSQDHPAPDVLMWQGPAPVAPRAFDPLMHAGQPERDSCCQGAISPAQNISSPGPLSEQTYSQYDHLVHPRPVNAVPTTVSMSQLSPEPFDFDKLRMAYLQHQFPNSICQNCGLSGCTCRNCPPIFQNFGTTSWAQCCGRKHAREPQTTPVPQKVPRTTKYDVSEGLRLQTTQAQASLHEPFREPGEFTLDNNHFQNDFTDVRLPAPDTPIDFSDFELHPEFGQPLNMPMDTEPLDLSVFLMSDLDRSQHELSTGAPITAEELVPKQDEDSGGGGGGGCCCR